MSDDGARDPASIAQTVIEVAESNKPELTSQAYLAICNASKSVYELEKRERVLKRSLAEAGIDPDGVLSDAREQEAEDDDGFDWDVWEDGEESDGDDEDDDDEPDGGYANHFSSSSDDDEAFSEHDRPRSGAGGSSNYVVESGGQGGRGARYWSVPENAIKRDYGRTQIVDSVGQYELMTSKGTRTCNWDEEKIDPAAIVVLSTTPRHGSSTALQNSWWVTISVKNTGRRRRFHDTILHQIPTQIVRRCVAAWREHRSMKNSSLLSVNTPGLEFHESSRVVPGPDRCFSDRRIARGNHWKSVSSVPFQREQAD